MKTISIILSSILFCFSSCDDFLEPKPLSFFTPENIYVDKEGMETVLVSLRRGLRDEYYGSHKLMCLEHYASDIAICTGENAEIHNWNTQVTPTVKSEGYNDGPQIIPNYYKLAYEQIRNANTVISRINSVNWKSEEDKNSILAEALFHRSYWYYRLVNQFGDVPFIDQEYSTVKIDFRTNSRKSILNKIQADMEFSVKWLPEDVRYGKVNRASGKHLLTKIYLSNCMFDKAVTCASDIIGDERYELMKNRFGKVANDEDYNVIWDLHQVENKSIPENKEGLLVLQDKYGFPDASTGGTNSMRDYVPFWCHANYIKDPDGKSGMVQTLFDPQLMAFGRGVGIVKPSPYSNFYIWNNCGQDLRHDNKKNWISRDKILYNNPDSKYFGQPVQIQYSNPRDTLRAFYEWPHYKIYVANEPTIGQPGGGNGDWYLFRLAETYLLRAEAYFWLGEKKLAADDLNAVRERAKAPKISESDVSIDAILDERARELFAEEPRKTELTRISFIMATQNLNGYTLENFSEKNYWYDRVMEKNLYNKGYEWGANAYEISPYHVLWPIPQEVIDANTGAVINQNKHYPGYEFNVEPVDVE